MVRKSPYRHTVNSHTRAGNPVNQYWRGSGLSQRSLPRRVVNPIRFEPLTSPINAEVLEREITGYEYDEEAEIKRPTDFKVIIQTTEDVRGHEDAEWSDAIMGLFPAMDNTFRAGYVIDRVDVSEDPWKDNTWIIEVFLKVEPVEEGVYEGLPAMEPPFLEGLEEEEFREEEREE